MMRSMPKRVPIQGGEKFFYGEWHRGLSGWVFHGRSVRSDTWSSSGLSFSVSLIALLRGQKDSLLSKKPTMYPGLWKGCGLMGQAHSLTVEQQSGAGLLCDTVRGRHPANPAAFWLLLPFPSSIEGIRVGGLVWVFFLSSWLTCPVAGTDPPANVCSGVICPRVAREHRSVCLHVTPRVLRCTFSSE